MSNQKQLRITVSPALAAKLLDVANRYSANDLEHCRPRFADPAETCLVDSRGGKVLMTYADLLELAKAVNAGEMV